MAHLTVALIAEEAAGVRALALLAQRGHHVAGVFSRGRGPVAGRARSLGITVIEPAEVRDPAAGEWLEAHGVQLLLNVHSLHILPPGVLAAPEIGAYNLHPGPLPERAGLQAPSWAIYEGSDYHGVTLHRMTPEVDAGPIAFADRFEIGPADTGLAVLTRCVDRGTPLIAELLDRAERGAPIPATEQDHSARRWYPAGPPQGGRIQWGRRAAEIVNFVRACDYRPFRGPWGFPRTTSGGDEIGVVVARSLARSGGSPPGSVIHAQSGAVQVAAADRWVLVERVELLGRAIAPAGAIPPGAVLQ